MPASQIDRRRNGTKTARGDGDLEQFRIAEYIERADVQIARGAITREESVIESAGVCAPRAVAAGRADVHRYGGRQIRRELDHNRLVCASADIREYVQLGSRHVEQRRVVDAETAALVNGGSVAGHQAWRSAGTSASGLNFEHVALRVGDVQVLVS